MPIQVGLKGRAETTVTPQNTAVAMGSGHSPVFATPAMVALMEQAAFTSLLPYLPEGEGTVGVHMDVVHESASPVGMKVWAESEVVSVDDLIYTEKLLEAFCSGWDDSLNLYKA